jgi:hypothetical protein
MIIRSPHWHTASHIAAWTFCLLVTAAVFASIAYLVVLR